MPWTTPGTAVAGDVLTATRWNTDVRDNSLMGNPVFTNEAARDAAITSPVEGQRCYLTAPTVPAAAGGSTVLPTGVQTIYNGSVWVCITPVASFTSNSGTYANTAYGSVLSGSPGTNPTVTLVTGTSALVTFSARMTNATGGAQTFLSVAVSGAGTVAASDDWCVKFDYTADPGGDVTYTMSTIIGGLTAGTNTFALNYRCSGTMTASFRRIHVQGIA
jgi:hypothetical protein